MSIGSIANNILQHYPLGLIGNLNPTASSAAGSAPVSAVGATQSSPAGGLFDALMQALTQSGALTSTTTDAKATSAIAAGSSSAAGKTSTATSGTESAQQSMQDFIRNLVTALQSQGTGASGAAGTTLHHGHGGHMKAAVQDLIQEVDSPDSSPTAAASSPALASLQQSFKSLVSTMGGSSNASLSGFLTNFANDLSGMNAVGNLVNTQA